MFISGNVTAECEELIEEGFGIAKGITADDNELLKKNTSMLVQLDLDKGDLQIKNWKTYEELFDYLYDKYNILSLGLYRKIDNCNTSTHNKLKSEYNNRRYVITNPKYDFQILKNDYVSKII